MPNSGYIDDAALIYSQPILLGKFHEYIWMQRNELFCKQGMKPSSYKGINGKFYDSLKPFLTELKENSTHNSKTVTSPQDKKAAGGDILRCIRNSSKLKKAPNECKYVASALAWSCFHTDNSDNSFYSIINKYYEDNSLALSGQKLKFRGYTSGGKHSARSDRSNSKSNTAGKKTEKNKSTWSQKKPDGKKEKSDDKDSGADNFFNWKRSNYKQSNGSCFGGEGGADQLVAILTVICDELSQEVGFTIIIDEYRVGECLFRAQSSILELKVPTEAVNIYAEVSYLAYWISRLKPMRFETPRTVFGSMKDFSSKLGGIFGGQSSKTENSSEEENQQYQNMLRFPINEAISVALMFDLVEASQRALADSLGDTAIRMQFLEELKLKKKAKISTSKRLQTFLRNDDHTTKSLYLLVESLLQLDIERNMTSHDW